VRLSDFAAGGVKIHLMRLHSAHLRKRIPESHVSEDLARNGIFGRAIFDPYAQTHS